MNNLYCQEPARDGRPLFPGWGKKIIHWLLTPLTFFCIAWLALLLTDRWQVLFSQLVDPAGLGAGLILGATLYALSVSLVQKRLFAPLSWWNALRHRPPEAHPGAWPVALLGARAVNEEFLWRGLVQVLLGSTLLAIVATAVLFTLRHLYLMLSARRKYPLRQYVEFFLFALMLGGVYAGSVRIAIPVGIHWMRNILILGQFMPRDRLEDHAVQPLD